MGQITKKKSKNANMQSFDNRKHRKKLKHNLRADFGANKMLKDLKICDECYFVVCSKVRSISIVLLGILKIIDVTEEKPT